MAQAIDDHRVEPRQHGVDPDAIAGLLRDSVPQRLHDRRAHRVAGGTGVLAGRGQLAQADQRPVVVAVEDRQVGRQGVRGRLLPVALDPEGPQDLGHGVGDGRVVGPDQRVLLGAEGVVEALARHAGALGDARHGRLVVAVLGDLADRRVDDPRAPPEVRRLRGQLRQLLEIG